MKMFFKGFALLMTVVAFVALGYGYYTLSNDIADLKASAARVDVNYVDSSQILDTTPVPVATVTPSADTAYYYSDCVDCSEVIKNLVASAVDDLPQTPVTVAESISTPKLQQTSYVPFGTTSTSTSTDWYTLDDADSFIDLRNDFSSNAYVTFEASLKVLHGNGQAFARLWDDTNKIAVIGSEITTSNNSEYQLVKSGRIYLWNGNNNYKVQLKSLNGYEVTYTNGKVKVVY